MKKIILSTIIAGALALTANAQEFNKFSLEVGGGFNKPMAPLNRAYLSPSLNLGHIEFGARYMFNEKFGLKLDYGFGSVHEARGNDSQSLPFDTKYFRLNMQGVANIGRIMNFESFTRKLGLLLHGGAGIAHAGPAGGLVSATTRQRPAAAAATRTATRPGTLAGTVGGQLCATAAADGPPDTDPDTPAPPHGAQRSGQPAGGRRLRGGARVAAQALRVGRPPGRCRRRR